jgi:hypothetical protein
MNEGKPFGQRVVDQDWLSRHIVESRRAGVFFPAKCDAGLPPCDGPGCIDKTGCKSFQTFVEGKEGKKV